MGLHTSAESEPKKLLQLYFDLPDRKRQQRFADTAQAAEKYGVAQRTMQYWISNGLVQAVLIGSKYKVDLESVESYLRQCAQQREE